MTSSGRRLATKPWEFCRALVEDAGPRPGGSPGEACAAAYAADVLRTLGYQVHVDEFRVPPDPWTGPALLLLLAAAAGVAGVAAPGPAAALAAGAALAATMEAFGFPTLGLLLRTRRTQNVWARRTAEGPVARTLLLVAHLDAPRTLPDVWPRRPERLRAAALGVLAAAWAVPTLLAAAALLGAPALAAAALAPAAACAAGAAALLAARGGRPTPGANDAASGVAAVLAAAGEHAARPLAQSHLEVLLTGAAEHGPWGVRRFSRAYGRHYLRDRTVVLDVGGVGRGTLAALETEGLLARTRGDAEAVAALQAAARHEGQRLRRAALALPGDGHAARMRRWRAATLVALENGDGIPDFHREEDTLARVDPLQVEAAARVVIAWTREMDRTA